ncbi:MAG: hypothetical protein WA056_02360 [Gallionella sp.]
MATYSGVLNMLGNANIHGGYIGYSVIDIGEHSLRKIGCSQYLANYLEVGKELTIEVGPAKKVFISTAIFSVWSVGAFIAGNPFLGFLLACGALFLYSFGSSADKVIKTVTVNGKTYKH